MEAFELLTAESPCSLDKPSLACKLHFALRSTDHQSELPSGSIRAPDTGSCFFTTPLVSPNSDTEHTQFHPSELWAKVQSQ